MAVVALAFVDDAQKHLAAGDAGVGDENHDFYAARRGFERVEADPIIGEAPGQAIYRNTVSRG